MMKSYLLARKPLTVGDIYMINRGKGIYTGDLLFVF